MVSKLTFKGDKPKKKKKVVKKSEKSTENSKLEESIEPSLIETSWTSATVFQDLNGPLMLTAYNKSEEVDHLAAVPFALAVNDLNSITLREDLGILDQEVTVNFPFEDTDPLAYYAFIHRTEPTDVLQVFVAASLSSMVAGTVHPNRTKLALKAANEKYLTANGNKVDSSSEAISPSQIWELERVIRKDEGVWFRLINGEKKLIVDDGSLRLVPYEETGSDLFVIRLQAKNSVTGKKLLREYEEYKTVGGDSLSHSVNQAVESLTRSGIQVTNLTLKRLKNAALNGKINEQLILERQKGKSDSRC